MISTSVARAREGVFEWLKRAEKQISASQEAIRIQAKDFWSQIYPDKPMPPFSNGWLVGSQKCAEIKSKLNYGEAGSLSQDAENDMIYIRRFLALYQPQDIFSCDETGLCWKMIPDRSLSTRSIKGKQKEKARISVHFCCNADASQRLPLWFIGSAVRPRAIARAGINVENLGCFWRSNKKAWMIGSLFKEWLLWFDSLMTGRKVILLMDNVSAHASAFEQVINQLRNTLIVWLPANSTSKYQPLDQGIIRTWKAYWKRQWIHFMLSEFDKGFDPVSKVTVLHAIRWSLLAWNMDVADSTIINCFKKAFTLDEAEETDTRQIESEIGMGIRSLVQSNYIKDAMDVQQFLNPRDEEVTDSLTGIDAMILSEFAPMRESEDEDDNETEPDPIISALQAVESLRILRLYEEQQPDGNRALIQLLNRHERVLLAKNVDSQHQADIRNYFAFPT